ncbi:hypothetical protein ES703_73019 [subsurface metagenome]
MVLVDKEFESLGCSFIEQLLPLRVSLVGNSLLDPKRCSHPPIAKIPFLNTLLLQDIA